MKFLRSHSLKLAVAAVTALVAIAGSFGIERAMAQIIPTTLGADHYLGYKITVAATPAFTPAVVELQDQLDQSKQFNVIEPIRLYNPAAKRITIEHTAGVTNPDLHYVGYKIKPVDGIPGNVFDAGLLVRDQFGTFIVEARNATMLMVPSAKKIGGAPEPLDPVADAANHYRCYEIRVQQSYNSNGIFGLPVGLRDEFRQPRLFKVGAPTMLCNPVRKVHNAQESQIVDPFTHLLCHKTAPFTALRPVANIGTLDQFGALKMRATLETDLCVPAQKAHNLAMPPIDIVPQ